MGVSVREDRFFHSLEIDPTAYDFARFPGARDVHADRVDESVCSHHVSVDCATQPVGTRRTTTARTETTCEERGIEGEDTVHIVVRACDKLGGHTVQQ